MKDTNFVALKAYMGAWEYYICRMPFLEAVDYLHFAEEVRPYEDLDTLLQRELSSRASQITRFLENNKERFFGALIVAVYGGCPRFSQIELEASLFLDSRTCSAGILHFDGKERYYVLDGQHRLAAMREVAKKNSERYAKDEITVILVSHSDDSCGFQRARRLFTNVNRYAVKTSKVTNIALDEDDALAILTRRLVRENQYFRRVTKVVKRDKEGIVHLVAGEALHPGADKDVLMTLPTLYECNRNLLTGHDLLSRTQQRPEESELEAVWEELCERWTMILEGVPNLQFKSNRPLFIRDKDNGGDLIARPIGQKAVTIAVGEAYRNNVEKGKILSAILKVPHLSQQPWSGLLYNPRGGKMFSGKDRMLLASRIIKYWMGLTENVYEIDSQLNELTPGMSLPRLGSIDKRQRP